MAGRTNSAARATGATEAAGGRLRRNRAEAWWLAVAVGVVCVATAVAAAGAVPAVSWRHSMISDLGSSTCILRGGTPMCSPRAAWLNGGFLLAGSCVLVAAAHAVRRWDRATLAGLVCLGVGLLVLGACPSDRSHAVHMLGAVLALPACAACILVSGVTDEVAPRKDRRLRTLLGAVGLVVCVVHLAPDAVPVPRAVAEAVSVAAVVAVLALEIARPRPPRAPASRR